MEIIILLLYFIVNRIKSNITTNVRSINTANGLSQNWKKKQLHYQSLLRSFGEPFRGYCLTTVTCARWLQQLGLAYSIFYTRTNVQLVKLNATISSEFYIVQLILWPLFENICKIFSLKPHDTIFKWILNLINTILGLYRKIFI